jgi:hypothetical protein
MEAAHRSSWGVVQPWQPHWPKFYTPANWYPDPNGGAG